MTTQTHIPNPYDLLFSAGPVVQISDRWFITINKAGFNLPQNNGRGWATEAEARAAHRQCIMTTAAAQQIGRSAARSAYHRWDRWENAETVVLRWWKYAEDQLHAEYVHDDDAQWAAAKQAYRTEAEYFFGDAAFVVLEQ